MPLCLCYSIRQLRGETEKLDGSREAWAVAQPCRLAFGHILTLRGIYTVLYGYHDGSDSLTCALVWKKVTLAFTSDSGVGRGRYGLASLVLAILPRLFLLASVAVASALDLAHAKLDWWMLSPCLAASGVTAGLATLGNSEMTAVWSALFIILCAVVATIAVSFAWVLIVLRGKRRAMLARSDRLDQQKTLRTMGQRSNASIAVSQPSSMSPRAAFTTTCDSPRSQEYYQMPSSAAVQPVRSVSGQISINLYSTATSPDVSLPTVDVEVARAGVLPAGVSQNDGTVPVCARAYIGLARDDSTSGNDVSTERGREAMLIVVGYLISALLGFVSHTDSGLWEEHVGIDKLSQMLLCPFFISRIIEPTAIDSIAPVTLLILAVCLQAPWLSLQDHWRQREGSRRSPTSSVPPSEKLAEHSGARAQVSSTADSKPFNRKGSFSRLFRLRSQSFLHPAPRASEGVQKSAVLLGGGFTRKRQTAPNIPSNARDLDEEEELEYVASAGHRQQRIISSTPPVHSSHHLETLVSRLLRRSSSAPTSSLRPPPPPLLSTPVTAMKGTRSPLSSAKSVSPFPPRSTASNPDYSIDFLSSMLLPQLVPGVQISNRTSVHSRLPHPLSNRSLEQRWGRSKRLSRKQGSSTAHEQRDYGWPAEGTASENESSAEEGRSVAIRLVSPIIKPQSSSGGDSIESQYEMIDYPTEEGLVQRERDVQESQEKDWSIRSFEDTFIHRAGDESRCARQLATQASRESSESSMGVDLEEGESEIDLIIRAPSPILDTSTTIMVSTDQVQVEGVVDTAVSGDDEAEEEAQALNLLNRRSQECIQGLVGELDNYIHSLRSSLSGEELDDAISFDDGDAEENEMEGELADLSTLLEVEEEEDEIWLPELGLQRSSSEMLRGNLDRRGGVSLESQYCTFTFFEDRQLY